MSNAIKRKDSSDRGMKTTIVSKSGQQSRSPEPKSIDGRVVPTSKSAPKILQLSKAPLSPGKKSLDEQGLNSARESSVTFRDQQPPLSARHDRQAVEALSAFVSVQSKRAGVEESLASDTESLKQHRRLLYSRLTHLELLRQAEERKRTRYNELVNAFMTANIVSNSATGSSHQSASSIHSSNNAMASGAEQQSTSSPSSTAASNNSNGPSSLLVLSNSNPSIPSASDKPSTNSSPAKEKREKRLGRSSAGSVAFAEANTGSSNPSLASLMRRYTSIIVHFSDNSQKSFTVHPSDVHVRDIVRKACFFKACEHERMAAMDMHGKALTPATALESLAENQFYLVEKGTLLWDKVIRSGKHATRLSDSNSSAHISSHGSHVKEKRSSSASTIHASPSSSSIGGIANSHVPIGEMKPAKSVDAQVDDFLSSLGQLETSERKLAEKWTGMVTKCGTEGVRICEIPRFLVGIHGEKELEFLIKPEELGAKNKGTICEIITKTIMQMEFEVKDTCLNNPSLLQHCLASESLHKERRRVHLENVAYGRRLLLESKKYKLPEEAALRALEARVVRTCAWERLEAPTRRENVEVYRKARRRRAFPSTASSNPMVVVDEHRSRSIGTYARSESGTASPTKLLHRDSPPSPLLSRSFSRRFNDAKGDASDKRVLNEVKSAKPVQHALPAREDVPFGLFVVQLPEEVKKTLPLIVNNKKTLKEVIVRMYERTFQGRYYHSALLFIDGDGFEQSHETLLGEVPSRFIWVKDPDSDSSVKDTSEEKYSTSTSGNEHSHSDKGSSTSDHGQIKTKGRTVSFSSASRDRSMSCSSDDGTRPAPPGRKAAAESDGALPVLNQSAGKRQSTARPDLRKRSFSRADPNLTIDGDLTRGRSRSNQMTLEEGEARPLIDQIVKRSSGGLTSSAGGGAEQRERRKTRDGSASPLSESTGRTLPRHTTSRSAFNSMEINLPNHSTSPRVHSASPSLQTSQEVSISPAGECSLAGLDAAQAKSPSESSGSVLLTINVAVDNDVSSPNPSTTPISDVSLEGEGENESVAVKRILRRRAVSASGNLRPALLSHSGLTALLRESLPAQPKASAHGSNETRSRERSSHKTDSPHKSRSKASSHSRERDASGVAGNDSLTSSASNHGSSNINNKRASDQHHHVTSVERRRHSCGDLASLLLFFAPFASTPLYFEFLPESSNEMLSEWSLPHADIDAFGCSEKVAARYVQSRESDLNSFQYDGEEITAASLRDLILRLLYIGGSVYQAFFLSLHYILPDERQLMNFLILLYRFPAITEQSSATKSLARRAVCNCLKQWIALACPDQPTISLFYQFLDMLKCSKDETAKLAARELEERYLHVRLDRILEAQHISLSSVAPLSPTALLSPTSNPLMSGSVSLAFILEEVEREGLKESASTLSLLDISVEDMAQQLTLMEEVMLQKLQLSDFYRSAWTKKDRAPNLEAATLWFNSMSAWIATTILTSMYVEERTTILVYWLKVLKLLMEWNNYNTCLLIYVTLNKTIIQRQKKIWTRIVKTEVDGILDAFELLIAKNYRLYREQINNLVASQEKALDTPFIPILSLLLRDLTMIEEMDDTEEGLVHWSKIILLEKALRVVIAAKRVRYGFQHIAAIDNFFKHREVVADDLLEALSLQHEAVVEKLPDKQSEKQKKKMSKKVAIQFKPNPHQPVIYRSLFFYSFGKYLRELGNQASLLTLYFACFKLKQLSLHKDEWREDFEFTKSYIHHFFLNPKTSGNTSIVSKLDLKVDIDETLPSNDVFFHALDWVVKILDSHFADYFPHADPILNLKDGTIFKNSVSIFKQSLF